MSGFENKVILITGATSGLGAAAADQSSISLRSMARSTATLAIAAMSPANGA